MEKLNKNGDISEIKEFEGKSSEEEEEEGSTESPESLEEESATEGQESNEGPESNEGQAIPGETSRPTIIASEHLKPIDLNNPIPFEPEEPSYVLVPNRNQQQVVTASQHVKPVYLNQAHVQPPLTPFYNVYANQYYINRRPLAPVQPAAVPQLIYFRRRYLPNAIAAPILHQPKAATASFPAVVLNRPKAVAASIPASVLRREQNSQTQNFDVAQFAPEVNNYDQIF